MTSALPVAERLEAHCQALSLPWDPGWAAPVATHLRLLQRWAPRVNLTSVSDPPAALTRHVVDSLALLRLEAVRGATGRAADVGSGAGFPGIPLAIALPHVDWLLVEPRTKRGAFLSQVIAAAGLTNARWVSARLPESAEQLGSSFGLVVSRATLAPRDLAAATRDLLRRGAVLACMAATAPDGPAPDGFELQQTERFELDGAKRVVLAWRRT